MVFGRKVLRKILGTTKERDGTWRIKTNGELNELIRHRNIVEYDKSHKNPTVKQVWPFTSNGGRENGKESM